MFTSDYVGRHRVKAMTDSNFTVAQVPEQAALVLVGKELLFPGGLLGFPSYRRYRLNRFNAGAESESPFLILESLDHELSFPLIHPDLVALDYRVPVSPEILASLEPKTADDLVPLLIVTVRERVEDITVNLQGPLIVNSASLIGTQLVIEEYPVRYALIQAESTK